MGEKYVDRTAHEPSSTRGRLEVALVAAFGLAAVAAVALGLSRSGPDPPSRADPIVARQTPTAGHVEPPEPAPGLPATSSCRTDAAGTVTCADPGPFVKSLQIRTYPTRHDLYTAYVRDVEAVTGRPFRGNEGDCTGSRSEGEVSWSLDRTKSRAFPVRLLRNGLLDPTTEAAGRVFCTSGSGDDATVIWTQDPFRLATATGSPAQRVTKWWVDAHLRLACEDAPTLCPVRDERSSP